MILKIVAKWGQTISSITITYEFGIELSFYDHLIKEG